MSQPSIEWRPQTAYRVEEVANFIDTVAGEVVETYNLSENELFMADYRGGSNHIVAEFETEDGVEAKKLERSWDRSCSLEDWRNFLDSIGGRSNLEDLYCTETVQGTNSAHAAMANSWNYESRKRPFRLWLTTEAEPRYQEVIETEFSAGLTANKYPMEQKTVTEELDTFANSIRDTLGFETKKVEKTETTKHGVEGNVFFIDGNSVYANPIMQAEREDIEQIFEGLGNDYSIDLSEN